jgi:hypothetical protein
MNNKLSITATDEILRIRNLLQQVSHISFSFSKVNQSNPLETLDESSAKELIHFYHGLFNDLKKIAKDYEDIYGKPTT